MSLVRELAEQHSCQQSPDKSWSTPSGERRKMLELASGPQRSLRNRTIYKVPKWRPMKIQMQVALTHYFGEKQVLC
jgi:hypothetical protein